MSKQFLNRHGWLASTRFVVFLAIGILWALPATARDRPVILIGIVDAPKDSETGLFVGDVDLLGDSSSTPTTSPGSGSQLLFAITGCITIG